jgi:hypothetical protein
MNIPEGLKHVLEVYKRVNESGSSYPDAVRGLTANSRITAATIRAACTTNLGIKTYEFEKSLNPCASDGFKEFLSRRFPAQQDYIHKFVNAVLGKVDQVAKEPFETLFPNEKRRLISIFFLRNLAADFEKWMERNDIPPDVKESLKEHLKLAKQI